MRIKHMEPYLSSEQDCSRRIQINPSKQEYYVICDDSV